MLFIKASFVDIKAVLGPSCFSFKFMFKSTYFVGIGLLRLFKATLSFFSQGSYLKLLTVEVASIISFYSLTVPINKIPLLQSTNLHNFQDNDLFIHFPFKMFNLYLLMYLLFRFSVVYPDELGQVQAESYIMQT